MLGGSVDAGQAGTSNERLNGGAVNISSLKHWSSLYSIQQ
jgi:hypothetical protein